MPRKRSTTVIAQAAAQLSQGLVLPPRWNQLRPHPNGEAYSLSPHRFNTVHAGRRSGKTERFKRKLIMRALAHAMDWPGRYFAGAPTRDQAKRIYWNDLKVLSPPNLLAGRPSEGDLVIRYINGSEIHVLGMDKPERIEGSPWDGGGLDEYGNMKPKTWEQNVRPALSDRLGWCDFVGVPEGRNHYFDLDQKAVEMMKELGPRSEWGSFHWESIEVLPASEVEAAKRDLDELTFDQEYRGSFINFEGRAYYNFLRETHTSRRLKYDPRRPLGLCFDFNVDPGVCAVVQEQKLPGQYERTPAGILLPNSPLWGTGVIGEVWIPRNSNTEAVCRKIVQDWKDHNGLVVCYGDATGGNRGSAKTQGSDWDLVKATLRPTFGTRLVFKVKSSNPAERARINAMNSRLKSISQEIRMMVDPEKAPHVVTDFEGVSLLKGGSGEIEKIPGSPLTHLTDGLGYYVDYEFPVHESEMTEQDVGGV